MFAIGVIGFDLNNATERYFTIEMIEKQAVNETYTDLRTVSLVPCTTEHFGQTDQIRNNFLTMGMDRRLCPELNYTFSIFGKETSSIW